MLNSNEKLGMVVRNYRKLKNYSTQELAEALEVSTGFVSNLEHGKNDVFKLDLLLKLIDKLDIPISQLLPDDNIIIDTISIKPALKKIEIDLSIYDIEKIEDFEHSLSILLTTYLDVLNELDYDKKFTELLTTQLVSQLLLIKNVKCS